MQEILKLDDSTVRNSSNKITFSKLPTEMSVSKYLENTSEFWKKSEIKKTLQVLIENRRNYCCTLSEWKLLQCGFLHLCMTRKAAGQNCDFLLLGTAWHHDETHLRHISFGNWGTLEAKEKTSYADLLDVASPLGCDVLSAQLAESLHGVLINHGLGDLIEDLKKEKTIFQTDPYAMDIETLCWKLLSGSVSNWKELSLDDEDQNYDDLLSQEPNDDGCLSLLYFNVKQELKIKYLTSMYTTEPRLITNESIEINWNF